MTGGLMSEAERLESGEMDPELRFLAEFYDLCADHAVVERFLRMVTSGRTDFNQELIAQVSEEKERMQRKMDAARDKLDTIRTRS